jgi:multiple antibiotic resistance protein
MAESAMLEFVTTAFITLFVVIDPIGILPMFITLTRGKSGAFRHRIAIRSVTIAALTLVAFAVSGDLVFRLLGITLPAFRIAGGLLLLLLSIDMILVRQSGIRTATPAETAEAEDSTDMAVFPLAVPLIAGPGAMTSVMLIVGRAQGELLLQVTAIGLLLVVLALCLLVFLFASKLMEALGLTGINVVGRVFGIVLAGLAVQYILDGFTVAFPALQPR